MRLLYIKYIALLFTFYCQSCSSKQKQNDIIIENDKSVIQHKSITNIKNPYDRFLHEIKILDKKDYKLKIDTIKIGTIKGVIRCQIIDSTKMNFEVIAQKNVLWDNKFSSKLGCNKRLIINTKPLIFSFCYNDVLDYLKYLVDSDVAFIKYKEVIDVISKNDSKVIFLDADRLLIDLIRGISYDIIDNSSKLRVIKVAIGDFISLSSYDREAYFINTKNDTIALLKL